MPQALETGAVRVMLVDDSAIVRGLLSRILDADPDIHVVASVQDGEKALAAVKRDAIDVVVLDIEMPVMDGLTALPKLIAAKPGIAVIMASTLTRRNAEVSLKALQAGAADYVAKPSSHGGMSNADDFKRELVAKVKALGRTGARRPGPARPRSGVTPDRPRSGVTPNRPRSGVTPAQPRSGATPARPAAAPTVRPVPRAGGSTIPPKAIAVGSSTGGPQALLKLFGDLGGGLAQPIFVTQHMPRTFTALLAENVQRNTAFTAGEGRDGEVARGGHVYIAPGDYHMEITGMPNEPVIRTNQNPPENFCRPAVDPMLRSLTKVYGGGLLVIVLTGMGSDGKNGCEDVVAAGGSVIAQDEDSSVVWGMPGAVSNAGLCSAVLPLTEIAPYVRKLLMRSAA